ncbi:cupin domain-containing protein [Ichthyenterobacterium magnum]|uniref:Cupin 2 conserved barrel domain-containing protein n=1 Tax=Ichthyenterobacterium magnum TaxID=1230530 RepID=A0A420DVS5_9FLAO|nr:cupin domain-containing protein [Ichthyenterobacterium magnum]RKE98316.1 hypothetical protein BXY80_0398 [Ichthyenterobacterium magnum]
MIKQFCNTNKNSFLIIGSIFSIIFLFNCKNKSTLPDPLEAGWNNIAVCEVLEDNESLRALKCTFPPSVGHNRHYHNAHFGYAISGGRMRIKDTTGIREVTIKKGAHFSSDGIDWHEVINIGDSTAIFLIIEPK